MKRNGFTLIELMITIAIMLVMIGLSIMIFNPTDQRKRSRDVTRLSNLMSIDRAINEYRIDNNSYPDSVNIERRSTTLPSGNSGPNVVCSDGWIDANLCTYISKLYIDPINDANYFYSYISSGSSYELNAVLEYSIDEMLNDGGNSDVRYELGNNLALL